MSEIRYGGGGLAILLTVTGENPIPCYIPGHGGGGVWANEGADVFGRYWEVGGVVDLGAERDWADAALLCDLKL
jgi:hypothetical protein